AGALAGEEGRDDAVGEHDRAHLVGDAARDGERLVVGLAARVHDPGAREPEVVEGWRAALRPLAPVAAGARVDEARGLGAEGGRVEPEPGRHALAEDPYEHGRALREAL